MAIELPRIPYKRKANRRFNYVPKYYDPEKERLQAQIDFHKKKSISKNEDIEQVKRNIRNSFSYNNIEKTRYNLDEKGRNVRTFLIAILLIVIFYFVVDGNLLDKLFYIFYSK